MGGLDLIDPHSPGDYIKRWVPELKNVDPARFAKAPSEKLVPDYPLPMVDHAREREITLHRFRDALSSRAPE